MLIPTKRITVDLGNGIVKTSEGEKFQAKFSLTPNMMGTDKLVLEYDGTTYYMGEGKYSDITFAKYENPYLMQYLITAIAMSTNSTCIQLGVGLPVAQYKKHKDEFKKAITKEQVINFKFNGIYRTIILDEVEVFPEGVGAYFLLGLKRAIIIDLGAKTTDIVYMTPQATNPTSLLYGTLDIYNMIAKSIGDKYSVKLAIDDIPDILENGFYYTNKETGQLEKQDIGFALKTTTEIFREVYNALKLGDYPIDTTPVVLIGGGAKLLARVLKNKIPHLQVNEDIFLNAKGYKVMLDKILGGN